MKILFGCFLCAMLLVSTMLSFHFLTQYFGQKTGYFLGFIFYWLFWCTVVPVWLIGKNAVIELLKIKQSLLGKRRILNILFLTLPLVLVYVYEFPKVLKQADMLIIFTSLGISIANATAEEILWRGTFLKLMGENSKWYIPFSSFGFATWHFAPLSVFGNHNPGGAVSFIAVSFLLGLIYSTVVKDSKSVFLTTISHILFDFSGLGARIYF